jgi:hypothetical protein
LVRRENALHHKTGGILCRILKVKSHSLLLHSSRASSFIAVHRLIHRVAHIYRQRVLSPVFFPAKRTVDSESESSLSGLIKMP